MHHSVSNILRSSTRKSGQRLNILTFSTHERYQSNMADVNANFWVINNPKIKTWNLNFSDIPKNHTMLNSISLLSDIPTYIDFDLIISQSKFVQFNLAVQIADYLKIPLVCIEHTEMFEDRKKFKHMVGDTNIFISDYSAKTWEANYAYYVIDHGINSSVFHNKNIKRENQALSIVNDWINRDYECGFTLWKEVTKDLPVYVAGDTPNFSKPAKNTEELIDIYNRNSIFLNTSIHSPVPTTLLEAMSCGCCVVTTKNEMIDSFIENGKNGFVSNDKDEIRKNLEVCLNNPDMCREIGKNARQTIIDKFSLKIFTEKWDYVLSRSLGK